MIDASVPGHGWCEVSHKCHMKFKSSSSQLRVKFNEQLEWPLVNIFPAHIHLDPKAPNRPNRPSKGLD